MIDTVRLRLRRPRRGDVDAVFAYRSRADVARHLRAGPWSREKTERELTRYATAGFGTFGDELVLLAETRDGGAVVGEVGLRWPDATGAAEVGYVFNPEFGGQGFATEAVRGVVSAAFERWAVAQVIAITDAANRDSRRLCERIGMHLAATSVSTDGRHVDECTYVLSRDRYDEAQPSC
jgi:RimJ/RimL family protein N-acetyltransferase